MVSTSSCQAASIIPSHLLCPDHKTLPVPQISSLHFASPHPWMGVPAPAVTQRCFSLSDPVTLKCLPPWFIHSSTSIYFRNTCGASSASWALEIQLHRIDGPSVPPHFCSSCLVTSLKHPQAQSNSLSSSQPPPCPPSLPMCSFYLQPHVSSVFANAALFPCNTLLSTSTRPSYSYPPRSCSRAPSFSQWYGENCVPLNFICRRSNSQ